MDVNLPGRLLQYSEGEALRQTIVSAINFLQEIESLAAQPQSKFAPIARQYREDLQYTVQRTLEMLRVILPIAPYVGGPRATELNAVMAAAVSSAVALRDDPSLNVLDAAGSSLMAAVRAASDLIILGATIEEGRQAAVAAATSIREAAEANVTGRQKEVDATAAALRQEINGASERLREETEKLIGELSARGQEVVVRAKKELAGEILTDAQRQFSSAQRSMNTQVGIWAGLAGAALAAFFWFATVVMRTQELPDEWTWQIAFYAGIRVIILGGVAAVASFCLRMLKAHIGLAQLNAHRTRIAQSIPSFLEVAPADQRFAVLNAFLQSIVGVRESMVLDDNAETLLATASVLEQAAKTAKKSG